MLLGLIMKFLLSALTIRPKYMTIIPPGPNLKAEFKNFGRSSVYLITQQSDQLYFPSDQHWYGFFYSCAYSIIWVHFYHKKTLLHSRQVWFFLHDGLVCFSNNKWLFCQCLFATSGRGAVLTMPRPQTSDLLFFWYSWSRVLSNKTSFWIFFHFFAVFNPLWILLQSDSLTTLVASKKMCKWNITWFQ